jgi:cytochrome c oxidase subunit 2
VEVELYAKQFDWTARYPGADGVLGATDFRLINGTNPLGIVTKESIQLRMDEIGCFQIAGSDSLLANTIMADNKRAEVTEQVERMRRTQARIVNLRTVMELDIKEKGFCQPIPHGADDIVIKDFHLPVRKEAKILIRSRDVIHSAYIPHLRSQMNAVPGHDHHHEDGSDHHHG